MGDRTSGLVDAVAILYGLPTGCSWIHTYRAWYLTRPDQPYGRIEFSDDPGRLGTLLGIGVHVPGLSVDMTPEVAAEHVLRWAVADIGARLAEVPRG